MMQNKIKLKEFKNGDGFYGGSSSLVFLPPNLVLVLEFLGKRTRVSILADEILKKVEYNALRIVFNKFHSVVSFVPTVSTVLSPEIVERESESGGKLGELDPYEVEGDETKGEILQNLAKFQFSYVSPCCLKEMSLFLVILRESHTM
ncbi:ATP synthase subunit gamma, mitochondrial [Gossypium raimondii]|uniref:ATP synthase subunit gamma, mitochondrial n=1 Tax=Gossypium raimondii TaxID=29730 RepID=UPI002279F852|nr:ATP synthase subunit gamma, mitochondrial [Gossypium raimondii]